jgi:hypothetical protein
MESDGKDILTIIYIPFLNFFLIITIATNKTGMTIKSGTWSM